MSQFTFAEIKRISFLAVIQAPALVNYEDPYQQARQWLDQMATDGFFEEAGAIRAARPTPASSTGPNRGSPRPASPSSTSSRGRDQGNQPFSGQLRDPDGPPTEKQVGAALKLTSDYTEDELWEMTKQQVSDLISDLKG